MRSAFGSVNSQFGGSLTNSRMTASYDTVGKSHRTRQTVGTFTGTVIPISADSALTLSGLLTDCKLIIFAPHTVNVKVGDTIVDDESVVYEVKGITGYFTHLELYVSVTESRDV